ncbi:MAG: YcxB family protein [Holophagaceae bacterium]|nr:YcxB family protein [Holophagaceae bacterium]
MAVDIRFHLTFDDQRAFAAAIGLRRSPYLAASLVLFLLGVGASVWDWRIHPERGGGWGSLGTVLFLASNLFLFSRERGWVSAAERDRVKRFMADTEGLSIEEYGGTLHWPWSAFRGFRETRGLLLFKTGAEQPLAVPVWAFQLGELEALKALILEAQVPAG